MAMVPLTGEIGWTWVLLVIVSTKKNKGAACKNSDVDGTCKRSFRRNYLIFRVKTVADLGFPRGGGANPPGKEANIQFCQIFPKTA